MFNASLCEDVDQLVQPAASCGWSEDLEEAKTRLWLESIRNSNSKLFKDASERECIKMIQQDVSRPTDVAQLTTCIYLIDKVEGHDRKCKQS